MMQKQPCSKCGGYVLLEKDVYGWYELCLQCSCMRYSVTMVELAKIRTNGATRKVLATHR